MTKIPCYKILLLSNFVDTIQTRRMYHIGGQKGSVQVRQIRGRGLPPMLAKRHFCLHNNPRLGSKIFGAKPQKFGAGGAVLENYGQMILGSLELPKCFAVKNCRKFLKVLGRFSVIQLADPLLKFFLRIISSFIFNCPLHYS